MKRKNEDTIVRIMNTLIIVADVRGSDWFRLVCHTAPPLPTPHSPYPTQRPELFSLLYIYGVIQTIPKMFLNQELHFVYINYNN